jgi:hypothetical protein
VRRQGRTGFRARSTRTQFINPIGPLEINFRLLKTAGRFSKDKNIDMMMEMNSTPVRVGNLVGNLKKRGGFSHAHL